MSAGSEAAAAAPARRVLLVTSSFTPTMIADMHRARMLAAELPGEGWAVEVLTAGPAFQRPECVEPAASGVLGIDGVPVHAVEPWFPVLFHLLGMGSIGWRALVPLYRRGRELLMGGRFDLVYLSTAHFVLFVLGRLWRHRCGVPYILDFHDPWYRPGESNRTTRHGWKFRLGSRLANHLERFAVGRAAALVAVSPHYLAELSARYASDGFEWSLPGRAEVIPFAALERDNRALEEGAAEGGRPGCELEVVYVGAGGAIMERALRALLRPLRRLLEAGVPGVERLKLRLAGTSSDWRPGDPKELELVATEEGLGDLVEESPGRVPFLDSLRRAARADGVLVLGVDDPAYMPSKLFPYALSGKPLLAALHAESRAADTFGELPGLGHLVTFGGGVGDGDAGAAEAAVRAWLEEVVQGREFDRRDLLAPHGARAMARRHTTLFEAILGGTEAVRPEEL